MRASGHAPSIPVSLRANANGVIISVQAHAGARRNGVTGVHDGRLKVSVTAAPEKGKANRALIDVLAAALSMKKSQISLVAGTTATHKEFLIEGTDCGSLEARLAAVLPP